MKKIIILILFLFLQHNSVAQPTFSNYLDNTCEWRYFAEGFNGINGTYSHYTTYYFDGYETINNVVYYKRYSKALHLDTYFSGNSTSNTYLNGPIFVREDILGNFIYINPNTNLEVTYFNNQPVLNAQVGDIFPQNGSDPNCLVQSIEYINLGTFTLKKINGSILNLSNGTVEGIGIIGSPCSFGFESGGGLNCFTRQNISYQFGSYDCSLFPTPNRTNLLVDNYISEIQLKVSPNPVNDFVNISFSDSVIIESVKIFNLTGQQVFDSNLKNSKIDVSNLLNGAYFIKIQTDKGAYNTRFLKK